MVLTFDIYDTTTNIRLIFLEMLLFIIYEISTVYLNLVCINSWKINFSKLKTDFTERTKNVQLIFGKKYVGLNNVLKSEAQTHKKLKLRFRDLINNK